MSPCYIVERKICESSTLGSDLKVDTVRARGGRWGTAGVSTRAHIIWLLIKMLIPLCFRESETGGGRSGRCWVHRLARSPN